MCFARNTCVCFCSKESRSLRVVRVELDSGQRLVGLRYPEQLIPEVTLFLKEQKVVDSVLVSDFVPYFLLTFSMKLVKLTSLQDFNGVLCRNNINLGNAIQRWIFFSEVLGFKSSDRITSINDIFCN